MTKLQKVRSSAGGTKSSFGRALGMKPNLPFSNVVSTAAAAPDQQQPRNGPRGASFSSSSLCTPWQHGTTNSTILLQQQHKDGSWLSVHEHLPTLPAAAAAD